jgi:hypothetical protein
MSGDTFLLAGDPEPKIEQPHSDAQRLLDWLQKWNRPVVSARDVQIWGPRPLRNREIATSSIEILIQRGWLAPAENRQRNWHKWRVVQKGPIVYPTVAAQVRSTVAA